MSTNTSSNRVVRFSQLGAPDVLQLAHEPVRKPEAGEIRLRAHALGLNRAEIMFRTGNYTETPQFPARIGSEAAGVVEARGRGRHRIQGWGSRQHVSRFLHEPRRRSALPTSKETASF